MNSTLFIGNNNFILSFHNTHQGRVITSARPIMITDFILLAGIEDDGT